MKLPLSIDPITVSGRPAFIRDADNSLVAVFMSPTDATDFVKLINQTNKQNVYPTTSNPSVET